MILRRLSLAYFLLTVTASSALAEECTQSTLDDADTLLACLSQHDANGRVARTIQPHDGCDITARKITNAIYKSIPGMTQDDRANCRVIADVINRLNERRAAWSGCLGYDPTGNPAQQVRACLEPYLAERRARGDASRVPALLARLPCQRMRSTYLSAMNDAYPQRDGPDGTLVRLPIGFIDPGCEVYDAIAASAKQDTAQVTADAEAARKADIEARQAARRDARETRETQRSERHSAAAAQTPMQQTETASTPKDDSTSATDAAATQADRTRKALERQAEEKQRYEQLLAAKKAAEAGEHLPWDPAIVPFDLGKNTLGNDDGVIKNLAPYWMSVGRCQDLTVTSKEGRIVLLGGIYQSGGKVDVACAMEKAGNKVTHVAKVKGSFTTNDIPRVIFFYQVRLADGHRLVIDGTTGSSSRGADGKKDNDDIYLYPDYRRAFSMETGRLYNNFQDRSAPYIENRPLAQLLLGGQPDEKLSRIGLSGGEKDAAGQRPAPTLQDVARAVRNKVNEFYPADGCITGFKSHLKIDSNIEVCVNFKDFRELSCERVFSDTDKFTCSFSLSVIPGSATHPQFNEMFRKQTGTTTITAATFAYDRGEYVLVTNRAGIDGIIPNEFE